MLYMCMRLCMCMVRTCLPIGNHDPLTMAYTMAYCLPVGNHEGGAAQRDEDASRLVRVRATSRVRVRVRVRATSRVRARG